MTSVRVSSLLRRTCLVFLSLGLLAGCASFGRGVTEALLGTQQNEAKDTRFCTIDGEAFSGIAPVLERQAADPVSAGNPDRVTTKLVYVHGIGDHQPGHSGELLRSLIETLQLSVRADVSKRIVLAPPSEVAPPYGEVNIIRLTDTERRRELLFYELTWNPITFEDKAILDFDKAVVYSGQRAAVNQRFRLFANSALPDPLAFIGNRGADIRGSVGQALCWALSARWQDLDALTEGVRCENTSAYGKRAAADELIIVTHSLGSRAAVDALQNAARRSDQALESADRGAQFAADLKTKRITLFMLSNQLPLLESGQPPQTVTGSGDDYCGPDAPHADGRFLEELDIVAFTDPNDIMSYPIPQTWARDYLDSRLCSNVRNVTINIAHVRPLPVLGEFADPLTAHTGYNTDQRVMEIMAHGIGNAGTSELVLDRCSWVEVDPLLN